MTEYIKSKALLNALLNALKEERKNGNFVFTTKWIKEIMDNLPAADVVEVVRCKDCEYFVIKPNYRLCSHKLNRTLNSLLEISSNHFCSYGKRKEGAD